MKATEIEITADKLLDCVERHITSDSKVNHILVAYSGGVDSHVLLHVCAQLKDKLSHLKFQSIYIDHGLNEHSSAWASHCEKVSEDLGINFLSEPVSVKGVKELGLEQAARLARYSALAQYVSSGVLLLTAQHQDDQAETFMLQLLRGSGVKGLSSMPIRSRFSEGYQIRPFLDCSQQEIIQYAQVLGLNWIEDLSNLNTSYDRNFLRQTVIPLIKERWPAFSKTTSRSAAHCAEAESLLNNFASTLVETNLDELELTYLAKLDAQAQRLVIRQWLANQNVRMPAEKVLREIQRLVTAKNITSAVIEWGGWQLRSFGSKFFITQFQPEGFSVMKWSGDGLALPEPLGSLSLVPICGQGVNKSLWESSDVTVSCRQGGESIKLIGRVGRKKLKKLFHEAAILPWVRGVIPLIYLNDKLVAVADIWLDESYLATGEQQGLLINWERPRLRVK